MRSLAWRCRYPRRGSAMPGRTPAEAVNEYIDAIQRAVSCLSDAVAHVGGGYHVSERPHTLELNNGRPARLGGPSRLWLSFQQYYRIVQSEVSRAMWTVVEEGYRYRIRDAGGREILAYHWHPTEYGYHASQPSAHWTWGDGWAGGTSQRAFAHRACVHQGYIAPAYRRPGRGAQAGRLGNSPGRAVNRPLLMMEGQAMNHG